MQQSLQKWFTPELHAAITEILPSNDPLDAPDFDPVDYINHMFPNEQSLVDVDKAISRLKLKINQTDETILREIRNQSNSSSSSSHSTSLQASGAGNIGEDLHQAKDSIQELFSKIHDIRRKAAESERMVQDICRDIKSLDFAKRHLTATITALKRLDMLVSSVDQLEVMSHKRQYREVGNLLEAITELSTAHFQQYRTVPKIAALNEKVTAIKQGLHEQIYKEFEGASKGREHISNAMNLTEACFVVDALGSEAKEEFIEWFAKQQLRDYEMAFASGSGGKSDRLEYTERRFEWLWQELQYYDQQFARIFPLGWNMDQVICQQFCRITRQHLTDILERNATTLGVELLTAVMKRTLDFEFKLSKRFVSRVPQIFASAEMRAAVLADGENGGENADEGKGANEIGDDDDMEDETELNPNSAEAIKRRLRRFQQKLAKQKEKRTGGQPGMAPIVSAQTLTADGPHQFKGVISASFEPYLSIFIDHLNTRMEREMKRRLEEEKWDIEGDMDEEDDDELMSSISKVARSATDMIHDFYKIMKECNALSKGQPFFDLYRLYKKFLSQYAKALDAKLSAVDKSNADYIALSNAEQRMTLLILNTAEYCANTTSSMSDTVIKLIDPAFVDNIDLTEQREAFEDVLAHSSKVLVRGLEGKLEPALAEMTKMSWATWEAVGDQSAYVTHILTVLSETIPLYRTWLSKSGGASGGGGGGGLGGLGAGGKVDVHFQHFCNQFI
ncbi:Vacuolar protein sorting-associated protein 53 [Balamuthia mandrillaris]